MLPQNHFKLNDIKKKFLVGKSEKSLQYAVLTKPIKTFVTSFI